MTITAETRHAFHELDANLPRGYRAELVDGDITVNPPPLGVHEFFFLRLTARLLRLSAIEVGVSGNYGITTAHGNFIPDVVVLEDDEIALDKPSWGAPVGVLLVAEITSSRPDTDREGKRRAYGAAGIPLYLLVDQDRCETVLYSDPDIEGQDYRDALHVPFGSDLELPAPFSFTLTDFTPPRSKASRGL